MDEQQCRRRYYSSSRVDSRTPYPSLYLSILGENTPRRTYSLNTPQFCVVLPRSPSTTRQDYCPPTKEAKVCDFEALNPKGPDAHTPRST